MKVTRGKVEPDFIPVTITLETQAEVDYLFSLIGNVSGTGKVRQFTGSMYKELNPYSSTGDNFFTESICCKNL